MKNISEEQKMTLYKECLEGQLIDSDEQILECILGDVWELFSQTRGKFIFTNKRVIFTGGFATVKSIPYNKVTDVSLCNAGGLIRLMPTGICINYTDDKNANKKMRMSVLKRKEILEMINNFINASKSQVNAF